MSDKDGPIPAVEEAMADVDTSPTGPEATGLRARLSISDRGVLVKASPGVLLLAIILLILIGRARRSSS